MKSDCHSALHRNGFFVTAGHLFIVAVLVFSAGDGTKMAEHRLSSPPVWEGMAAARGRLYLTLMDGSVTCFAGIYTVSPEK